MKNKSKCDAFAVDLGKQATDMFLPVYSHHRWHCLSVTLRCLHCKVQTVKVLIKL